MREKEVANHEIITKLVQSFGVDAIKNQLANIEKASTNSSRGFSKSVSEI